MFYDIAQYFGIGLGVFIGIKVFAIVTLAILYYRKNRVTQS